MLVGLSNVMDEHPIGGIPSHLTFLACPKFEGGGLQMPVPIISSHFTHLWKHTWNKFYIYVSIVATQNRYTHKTSEG